MYTSRRKSTSLRHISDWVTQRLSWWELKDKANKILREIGMKKTPKAGAKSRLPPHLI